jgi:hypothetical protein
MNHDEEPTPEVDFWLDPAFWEWAVVINVLVAPMAIATDSLLKLWFVQLVTMLACALICLIFKTLAFWRRDR